MSTSATYAVNLPLTNYIVGWYGTHFRKVLVTAIIKVFEKSLFNFFGCIFVIFRITYCSVIININNFA